MVNTFALSAALVGASIATVAQAATLKQGPLFGCESFTNGTLTLSKPGDEFPIAANFVAGHTMKSIVTGKSNNSVLATADRSGADVQAANFEFLNCTQSLLDRGYKLNVPANFRALNDESADEDETASYTYTWGILRNQSSRNHALSVRSAADSKGRLDSVPLIHTKVSETPIESRTFILASNDEGVTNYIEFYPFAGNATSAKSGIVFPSDKRFGTVKVSTKHAAHSGSTFLSILDGTPVFDDEIIDDDENAGLD